MRVWAVPFGAFYLPRFFFRVSLTTFGFFVSHDSSAGSLGSSSGPLDSSSGSRDRSGSQESESQEPSLEVYSAGDCLPLKEIAELARQKRKAQGETQEEAAAALGVEQPNVSRAENGRSGAKETLFRLVSRYTPLEVQPEPRYCLVEKPPAQ